MTNKSKGTPSLAPGQSWTPKSGPSPYRETLSGGVAHPPERNVEAERATKWFDPAKGAWSVAHGAKPGKRAPKGRAQWS
jgi:hypothetical protein